MKTFCATLLTFVLFLCLNMPASAGGHPSIEECNSIQVRSSEGWWLRINKDGSGSYGFGTGLARVETEKGTFDFEQVYADFEDEFTQKPVKAEGAYMAVSYWTEGTSSAVEYKLKQNPDYLTMLFKAARAHSLQPTNEFEGHSHNRVDHFWDSSPWKANRAISP